MKKTESFQLEASKLRIPFPKILERFNQDDVRSDHTTIRLVQFFYKCICCKVKQDFQLEEILLQKVFLVSIISSFYYPN